MLSSRSEEYRSLAQIVRCPDPAERNSSDRQNFLKLKPTKASTFGSTPNLIVAAIATVKMLPIKKPIAVV